MIYPILTWPLDHRSLINSISVPCLSACVPSYCYLYRTTFNIHLVGMVFQQCVYFDVYKQYKNVDAIKIKSIQLFWIQTKYNCI